MRQTSLVKWASTVFTGILIIASTLGAAQPFLNTMTSNKPTVDTSTFYETIKTSKDLAMLSHLFENLRIRKNFSADLLDTIKNMSPHKFLSNLPLSFILGKNLVDVDALNGLDAITNLSHLTMIEETLQHYNENISIPNNIVKTVFEKLKNIQTQYGIDASSSTAVNNIPHKIIIKFKDVKPSKNLLSNTEYLKKSLMPKVLSPLLADNVSLDKLEVEPVFKKKTGSNPSLFNVYKILLPKDVDVLKTIEICKQDPRVEYAEPDYTYQLFSVYPNDPYFSSQWPLNQSNDHDMDAPEAWSLETGDSSVTVAVIDTGVDYYHSDLAANIWNNTDEIPNNGVDDDGNGFIDDVRGWNFVYSNNAPLDDHGHGTHCAGIIGAVGNNSLGVTGVCWNCTIMPVKCFAANRLSFASTLAEGIVYAADNGADVISMSWGTYTNSQLVKEAIDYAYNKGVVLVAAAGNHDTLLRTYPAAYSNVIAVAATNQTDGKTMFSNWGSWVDVAAPGENVYSTYPYDNFRSMSGTSMACAYVAGLAALLLSYDNGISQETVKTVLKAAAEPVTSDQYKHVGVGRINAYLSLQKLADIHVELNNNLDDAVVSKNVFINGTATGADFHNYTLYYGSGVYPTGWTIINVSSTPVENNTLATWNTTSLSDGVYTIKLTVHGSNGYLYNDTVVVTVNNIVNTWHVGGSGPGNLSTIQSAVYSSGEDDTVHIHTGTYSENVVVNRGVNIVGEQRNTTTVEATHYLPFVFYVSQRDVNISNLTIGPYSLLGIMCVSVDNVTIYNNNLFSPVGVTLLSSLDTNIIHNIFSENVISILSLPFSLNLIFDSSLIMDQIETFSHTHGGLVIKNNNISNSHVGIMLLCADNNVITKNTIINLSPYTPDYINVLLLSSSGNRFQNNTLVNGGIFIYDSYNNQMHNNTVNGEPLVYLENLSHIVVDYGGQVILVNCDNITVENTVISNVSVAIELLGTNNSVIQNNDVSYCTLGVCMFSSHGNKVYSNRFHPALLAIVSTSGGNTIDGNTIQDSLVGVSVVSIESLTLSQPMENQIQLTVTGGDQPNIITNNNLSNVPFGIIVVSNASNTVENNTLTNPYSMKETGLGIAVISFETIQVQCFLNGTFQITARGGDGENSVTGNSLSNLTVGVVVISDAYNTITNNMLDNIYIGVVTVSIDSIHVTAEGELHTYGYTSGELSATTHVSIAGGNRDVVVEDNQLFNSELGIIIISDAANTVVNNTLDNTEILGVTIVSLKSVDITAAQTQIRNNSVYHLQGNLNLSIIGGEKDNIVEENTLFNPGVGVVLLSDGSNTVAGNTIVNAQVLGTTIVSMSSTTVEVEFKQKDVYNPSVHNRTINATIEVSLHSGGVNNVVENNNVSAAEAGVIIVSNANNMVTGNMLNDIQLTGVVMFSLDKVFVDAELNQRSTSNHTGRVENNNGTIQVSLTGGEKTNVVENNSLLTSRLCGVTVVSNSDNVIGNNTLRNTTFGAGIMAVSLEKADLSLNFSFITHGSLQHVHNFSSELHIHAVGGNHQNLIKDNKVQDSLLGIVAVSNADDTLFNNTLTNVESVGIMYVSLNSTSMSYDVNNSGYSFLFTAHGGETHSIIWDNQITDVDIQGGNLSSGVLVVSNANVTVENNTIHNLTTHKITTPTHNYSITSKGILLLPANIRYTENVNSQVVDALVEILPDNAVNGHILRNNDIDGSDAGTGVSLWYSSNHHIYGNTIKNTTYGIHIPFNQLQKELNSQYCNISASSYSNGSLIYHNNLINNTISAFDECNNIWDNGYPSGGNYWSDYTGTDFYRGPNQNLPGEDRIGDTPYNISGGDNKDLYPLMYQFGTIPPVANFTYSPLNPFVEENIQFTDSSYDIDGVIVNWTWSFGDGNKSHLQHPQHSYKTSGTYTVTLNVTDNSNKNSIVKRNITVTFDKEKPMILNVSASPDEQTMDGYVNITCNVMDNVAVDKVMVNITYPDGGYLNLSMKQLSGNLYYLNQSYSQIGTHHYFVWANDSNGNSNTSATLSFIITDIIPPVIVDNTPVVATTGDNLVFNASVTNTVEVSEVYVEYWYGTTGGHMNHSMTNTGGTYWEKTITVENTLETLHYIISAVDTSNNWNNTGQKSVTVVDNDKPGITSVQPKPSVQTQGGYVNITCNVTDNIAVNTVKTHVSGPPGFTTVNTTMTKTSGSRYFYNTTYLFAGTYQFIVWANDSSGNRATSNVYTFTVTKPSDNEKPRITSIVASPAQQTQGGYVNITCNVMDNVAVDKVMVNITYPDGGYLNLSMKQLSGNLYYLNRSYSQIGTHYYFVWANDSSGNSNTSGTEEFNVVPRFSIHISQPKTRSLYFKNHLIKFLHPRTTIIIGQLDVKAQVEGGEGNVTVRFYLENDHQATVTQPPYKYTLNERSLGRKYTIRVVAEDEYGHTTQDSVVVRIFNLS